MNVQKQPPEAFRKKMWSWEFHKIHRKAPVPETFFNKVFIEKEAVASGLQLY